MQLFWHAINKATGVTSQRLQTLVTGAQRALGLASRTVDDSQADQELRESSDASDSDVRIDGKPLSKGAKALELLQAGFSPAKDYHLYDDVKGIVEQATETAVKEYHIVMPQSVEMFIVPGMCSYFRVNSYDSCALQILAVCSKRVRSTLNLRNIYLIR